MKVGNRAALKCFAANLEQRYPEVFEAVQHNFRVLKSCNSAAEIAKKLVHAISKSSVGDKFRIHVHGDFLNKDYFTAWKAVARYFPRINFYAYTKSLHLMPKSSEKLPPNLDVTLSMGGKFDKRADEMDGYKRAHIVNSKEEADELGLQIDYDDSLANSGNKSFALLIHGGQIVGTKTSKLVTFYNWITPMLKDVGLSVNDVKKVKAKMRIADIANKILPHRKIDIFKRIHKSDLGEYFDDIPSKSELEKLSEKPKLDAKKVQAILKKLPANVVNQIQKSAESEEDLIATLQSLIDSHED